MLRIFIVLMLLIALTPLVVHAGQDLSVKQAQQILDSLGYQPGPIDGLWGKKTKEALKQFQIDNNLPITGKIDPDTKKILISKKGDVNEIDQIIQKRLSN